MSFRSEFDTIASVCGTLMVDLRDRVSQLLVSCSAVHWMDAVVFDTHKFVVFWFRGRDLDSALADCMC